MSRTDVNSSSSLDVCYTVRYGSYSKTGVPGGTITQYYCGSQVSGSPYKTRTTVRSGVTTAGYGKPRRRSVLPYNPFSFSETSYNPVMGTRRYVSTKYADGSWSWNESTGGLESDFHRAIQTSALRLYPNLAALRTQTLNRANTKCLSNIKANSANFALMFAERQKTVDLVAQTAKRLANAMLALRRGRLDQFADQIPGLVTKYSQKAYAKKHRRNPSKAAAQTWLEHRYGWMPLLMDIDDSCRFLAQGLSSPVYGYAEGSAHWEESAEYKFYVGEGYRFHQRETLKINCKVKIRYSASAESLAALARTGITNPIGLAWELLPFSFVVDWFLPVGQWLDTFDATLGVSFADGFATTYTKSESACFGDGASTSSVNGGSLLVSGSGSRQAVSVTRAKLTSFPSSAFPSFKDPTSVTHMISALALLRTAFK